MNKCDVKDVGINLDVLPIDGAENTADGRKVSPKLKPSLLENIEKYGNITDACKPLGITMRDVNRWQSEDEDFKEDVSLALMRVIDLADKVVREILMNPESTNKDKLSASDMIYKRNGIYVQRKEVKSTVNIAPGFADLANELRLNDITKSRTIEGRAKVLPNRKNHG